MHYVGMRTHKQIIQAAGAQSVIERAGLAVTIHTVRSWQQRDGIPGKYWSAISAAGIAPMGELAQAAAHRSANDTAAASKARAA